ncbi:gamma carbonic anhydrase 1, mitochondrial-like [Zingiber officinale]|uniref:gamma carbonic anhydrase 1, mitochondrial-like n=1 Tax=Zingiber officinale TaxID=94328 RepID=UPI001C4A8A58|nr:gamma carbonic anhydrase 1, mitochondrial-like [Zingiber officinale]
MKGDTVISSPAKTLLPSRLLLLAGLPFPLALSVSSIAAAAPFTPSPAPKGTTCLVALAISMGTLGRVIYTVGFWIRETGQAIDRLGSRLQGNYLFQEQISRHRTLMNIFDKVPNVHKDAFVAPSASVIGDVQVGHGSSIWYGCVLRGDVNSIYVGSGTNIQDNSLVHVAKSNLSGKVLPTIIGDNVTVGHSAVLHGCTVENESFVGMGAVLLDGVVVEEHGMVAAGSLVRQNTKIPSGEVWGGNPAKFLRKLTDEERAFIAQSATSYTNLAQVHAAENSKSFDEIEFEKLLRKRFARRDEEYDSMLGIVRETPAELILPDNILPDKARATTPSSQ